MSNIQHLMMAAGTSSRMGKPKQLLPWGNKTLIEYQITVLLETNQQVSVVLGAYAEKISKVIEKYPIDIYVNENWKKGMGTSIAYGVKQLIKKDPTVEGILISLIDQPLINATHFNKMLRFFEPGKGQINVSKSKDGWSGVPVLFDRAYFNELIDLQGDDGAKLIIKKYRNSVKLIDSEDSLKDIDTHEAYLELLKINTKK